MIFFSAYVLGYLGASPCRLTPTRHWKASKHTRTEEPKSCQCKLKTLIFIDPVADALALALCDTLGLALRLDEPLTSPFLKRMIVTTHCKTSTQFFVALSQHC